MRLTRSSGFQRGLILAIEAPPGQQPPGEDFLSLIAAYQSALEETGLFHHVRGGPPKGAAEAFRERIFPRRWALFAREPETEVPRRFSPEAVEEALNRLRESLASPSGTLVRILAPEDPLLLSMDILDRLERETASLSPNTWRDRWFSADLSTAILFAETVAPAFDSATQRQVLEQARNLFDHLEPVWCPGARLRLTGLPRFVVESETRARGDITRVSLISAIASVLLFLWFYRGVRHLPLVLIPVGAGMALATGSLVLLEGQVHGLTLAFGGLLIGAAMDYPVHTIHHLTLDPDFLRTGGFPRTLRRGLWAGFFTSLSAFGLLGLSSYPGLREIAWFCAVGLTGALVFTRAFVPLLMRRFPSPRLPPRIGFQVPRPLAWVWIALTAIPLLGLPGVRLESDARALDDASPETRADDAFVRSLLPTSAFPRQVVCSGADVEPVLRCNDRVHRLLAGLQRPGEAPFFASLSALLPSEDLQRRTLAALAALPGTLEEDLRQALTRAGFRLDRFEAFFQAFREAREGRVAILRPGDLDGTPLGEARDGLLFETPEGWAAVTLLAAPREMQDPTLLLAADPEVTVLDPGALVSRLITASQTETFALLWLGVLVNGVWMLLLRGRRGLWMLAPSVLALASVTGLLALLGTPLNFLHGVAMLLVLGLGVDYGIFLLDASEEGQVSRASGSVLLAAATTLAAFGAMAMARTPALVTVGVTVLVGLVAVLGNTAAVLSLSQRRRSP